MNQIVSSKEVAEKLCVALGIPFVAIRDIRISCKYDDAPNIVIEKLVTATEMDAIKTVLEEYELKKKEV